MCFRRRTTPCPPPPTRVWYVLRHIRPPGACKATLPAPYTTLLSLGRSTQHRAYLELAVARVTHAAKALSCRAWQWRWCLWRGWWLLGDGRAAGVSVAHGGRGAWRSHAAGELASALVHVERRGRRAPSACAKRIGLADTACGVRLGVLAALDGCMGILQMTATLVACRGPGGQSICDTMQSLCCICPF